MYYDITMKMDFTNVFIVYSVFIVMQNTTLLYFVQCLNILRIDNNAFLQI